MKANLSLKFLSLQISLAAALPRPVPQGPEDAIAFTSGSLVYESIESTTTPIAATTCESVCTTPRTSTVTGTTTIYQTISPPSASSAVEAPSSSMLVAQAPTSVSQISLKTTLTTSEVQTFTSESTILSSNTGIAQSVLNTTNHASSQPFPTTVISTTATQTLSGITSGSNVISTSTTIVPTASMSGNIFDAPIETDSPPAQFASRGDHPVSREGINNQTGPIETNKFYANLFLGTRLNPAWTHPYSLAWLAGNSNNSWGMSISHFEASDFYSGSSPAYVSNTQPDTGAGTQEYYGTAQGVHHMIMSASELGTTTDLTMDTLTGFAANVNLAVGPGQAPAITFPLVQGMGFVTGVYHDSTPLISTGLYFNGINGLLYAGNVGQGTYRYNVTLNDGHQWLIYITPSSGTAPVLTALNSTTIIGDQPFTGTVQIAKNPNASIPFLQIYDNSAGVYPTGGAISGTVTGSSGSYTLSWSKGGVTSRPLLMFALPHHVASMSASNYAAPAPAKSKMRRQSVGTQKTAILLQTTTKGVASGIVGDSWTMTEPNLPGTMGFSPWSPTSGSIDSISSTAAQLLNQVAAVELAEDMDAQTNLDSMYYAGKGLAKFAAMIYATANLGNNSPLASAGLVNLKGNMSRFVENEQIYPLVYDSAWGGIVSDASYVTGNPGADFGNTYYNDHHFHFGYFVYTAAVIAYLDPSWLEEGTNKAWVNALIRDYANPVTDDAYFPFSRMFDWYHGHSWAHGLFESGDGKDQESSSEDSFSLYAMKMWGKVIGDANMEARGNLQLAVQARALSNYYLLQNGNTVEPSYIVPNKVSGIIFEGKIDHTTYFGATNAYIEGIHMLPLAPSSAFTRPAAFVQQEWDTYFNNGRANTGDGWQGILYANLALVDPKSAWEFFAQGDFSPEWLDGGASRTWYLAMSAALGGA